MYLAGPDREERYYWGEPPPCRTPGESCPKGSPEEAPQHELSDRNWQTLQLYYRNRAVFGRLADRFDELATANMGIIDRLVRDHERHELIDSMAKLALRR